ncbi:hypothetical protein [Alteribacter natronophilus]|uniref:hypothetical protein n=1 Tax=Alteribacter natronophilus TaxID=2583810 RepID=UPI00110EFEE6|nr:hypothetical protein [Alteribacter natronophilus]TMW70677.1 hypothetical protein FGB90_15965 [Alteribacter natronophilus]
MRFKHRRKFALMLVLILLLQPFAMSVSVLVDPPAKTLAAEEEDEERSSPRPGVSGADDRSGNSGGSGTNPGSGGNGSGLPQFGNGGSADPEGGSPNTEGNRSNPQGGDPDTEGGNPDPGTGNPDAEGSNPNSDGGDPETGGGSPDPGTGNPDAEGGNPGSDGGNPETGGGSPDPGTGNPDTEGGNPGSGGGNPETGGGDPDPGTGNPDAEGSNPGSDGTDATGEGVNGSPGSQEGNGETGNRNQESERNYPGPDTEQASDSSGVKDYLQNAEVVDEAVQRRNHGKWPFGKSFYKALAGSLVQFDDPHDQALFNAGLTSAAQVSMAGKEVRNINQFVGNRTTMLSMLTPKPYINTVNHFGAHLHAGNNARAAHYMNNFRVFQEARYSREARHGVTAAKTAAPLLWAGERLASGGNRLAGFAQNVTSNVLSKVDQGLWRAGKSMAGVSTSSSYLDFRVAESRESLFSFRGNATNPAQRFLAATEPFTNAVRDRVGNVFSGLSTIRGHAASAVQSAGQAMSNASLSSGFSNAADRLGSAVSGSIDRVTGLGKSFSNSRIGEATAAVAKSPVGRVAGGLLNGYVAFEGYQGLTDSSAHWIDRTAGALDLASGTLGLAAAGAVVFGVATVAAPALVIGAAVTGVVALGLTYREEIKQAGRWLGEQGSKFISDPGGYVSDTASNVKESVGNLFSSGKETVSGWFGGS